MTLDLNISFTRRVKEGETVKAFSKVIHGGKTTMVVEGSITDEAGKLLAKARGTFFVIGYTTENGTPLFCSSQRELHPDEPKTFEMQRL